MTRTNKEVKFKYYSTPSARINDNSTSNDDVAFVKNGSAGEIYTKGYKFGMGAVSGDISVDDIEALSLTVGSNGTVTNTNTAEVYNTYIKLNNSITDEYIKFTKGGLEYCPEASAEYGAPAPTPVSLSWSTLINNVANAGSSSQAQQVTNVGWSDLSTTLQSHLLYVETEDSNNVDERTSITGAGGTLDLGSGSWKLLGTSSDYPKVLATTSGVSYWANSSSAVQYKTWADITSANQAGTLYWYEESAS